MSVTGLGDSEDLLDLLLGLYPEADRARMVADRAGLPITTINFAGAADQVWWQVLRAAGRQNGGLSRLMAIAAKDYPQIDVSAVMNSPGSSDARGPKLTDDRWKATQPAETLEKVLGSQPTFLPISWLETGLNRARSVVRIETPNGIGSGFLIAGDLVVTNHHVVPNKDIAQASRIQCNYQLTSAGLAATVEEFVLDPSVAFATSPLDGGDDWTVVHVRNTPCDRWGALPLNVSTVEPNDFVNIIQHPGGMPKQVALYHNVVTYADDSRVQYLTDTMPGSSGSPVFDSQWRIVALHHSGGWIPEPKSKQPAFRNEGIAAKALLAGLHASGIDITAIRA